MVVDWRIRRIRRLFIDATALAGPELVRDERFIFHTQGTIFLKATLLGGFFIYHYFSSF